MPARMEPGLSGDEVLMRPDESELQAPYAPRYYDQPCRCDSVRGCCGCEDDGSAAHNYHEMHEWTEEAPLRAHRVSQKSDAVYLR